jgi:hypothetical protein
MARHVWSVFCERALVDKHTESVSLINVVEEFILEGELPANRVDLPIQAALVSYWTRSERETSEYGRTRVRVVSPAGESLATGHVWELDLREERRAQLVSRIEMLPLQGEGIYQLVIEYRGEQETAWNEAARIPLEVWVHPPSEPETRPEEAPR